MDKHHEVAVCPFPNFGKLESWKVTCSFLLFKPLWVTVLPLVQANLFLVKKNRGGKSIVGREPSAAAVAAAQFGVYAVYVCAIQQHFIDA